MELLVVGAGSMGRWFGAAAGADVTFTDLDPDAAEAAAAAVGGAAVADPEESYDAVCIAVPMSATERAVREYAPLADRAMVDVTGAMATPVAAMRDHASDRERVSFHPLFAPENAPGNVAVVADAPGPVTDALRGALTERGNRCFETTPEEHDRAMETVQSAAHAAVLSFALAAEDVPEAFHTPISAGLADLVAGVTGNTAAVYAEIQAAFEGAERVAEAADRVATADDETFEALYREAGAVDLAVDAGRASADDEGGD